MSTGNRLMICAMTLVAIVCIVAGTVLALQGQVAVMAGLAAIASSALSSLSPSALHQSPPASPPAVAADNVEAVNVAAPTEATEAKP